MNYLPSKTMVQATLNDLPFYLRYIGSHRAIDFLNTSFVFRNIQFDLIHSLSDLLTWMHEGGMISQIEKDSLLQTYESTPQAQTLLWHVHQLRSILSTLVLQSRIENALSLQTQTLADFNQFAQGFTCVHEIQWNDDGIQSHRLKPVVPKPLALVYPFIEICIDFLANTNRNHLKQCENPECVLHFLDTSKNKSRRWCSMEHCGNLMKVKSFRLRQKSNLKSEPF